MLLLFPHCLSKCNNKPSLKSGESKFLSLITSYYKLSTKTFFFSASILKGFLRHNLVKFSISLPRVAENKSVCLFSPLVKDNISSISALNPISNNLSASSKTRYSKFVKSTPIEFLFKSTNLPGVAITISGSLLKSYSCQYRLVLPMANEADNLVPLFNL